MSPSEVSIHVEFGDRWTYGDDDAMGRDFRALAYYPALRLGKPTPVFEGRVGLAIGTDKKEAQIALTKPPVEESISREVGSRALLIEMISSPTRETSELVGSMILSQFPIAHDYDRAMEVAA